MAELGRRPRGSAAWSCAAVSIAVTCGKVGKMKHNRSVPPATVVPVLSYPDVRAAVAWLSAAFGFAERTRIGESHRAQMSIGADGAVIVAEHRGGKPGQAMG